ncbi:RidA family protein [Embleya sp. NBC_00896]|uniref:RidA family protein n=1 Tax=Embleya sp. NBC_00896 TaxID=2975961 RepID=UPI0038676066|nr:RidA family protein [Embleya sp. NBC_00896]
MDVESTDADLFMPYTPVIRVRTGGDLLFLSGATALPLYHQHPHEHDELDPPDDVRLQTRLVMDGLTRCLEAAGAGWADVVHTDLFVTDMNDQDAIGQVMSPYFQGNFPASTLLEVSRLVDPRLKLEMNAIAVVHPQEVTR